MKLPFHLINRTVQLLSDLNTVFHDDLYYDLYRKYLKEAGWSEKEYEAALLDHIDSNWAPQLN